MEVFERKNYYEVLEIPTTATIQEIHEAYNKAKNTYSDESVAMYSLMTIDECNKILEQIEEAYSILGEAEKRKEYDTVRGFNKVNTKEGFDERERGKISYAQKSSLLDMTNELISNNDFSTEKLKEEFKYTQELTAKHEVFVSKASAYKKFSLDYEIDNKFEEEIESTTDFSGEFLRKIREYKKVSIDRMADMTRISKTQLKGLESEDLKILPAPAYIRGFVYQYAKCLKLNPDLVAASFLHRLNNLKKQND